MKRNSFIVKFIAVFLTITFISELLLPTAALALTGGPSQPEVQSFEPVGTSQMVDLFSGDFSYNIPLLDIDGYPINIAYHSGITMDQEASWVGLGWNINAGVINRGINGIPDDFNGDVITKEFSRRANRTISVNKTNGMELFGFGNLSNTTGIKFNNYTGFAITRTSSASINILGGDKTPFNLGLGISSSSGEGLTIQPVVSFATTTKLSERTAVATAGGVGIAFNSRTGLSNLAIAMKSGIGTTEKPPPPSEQGDYDQKEAYLKMTDKLKKEVSSLMKSSLSSSFKFNQVSYSPNIDMPMRNLTITGKFTGGGSVFGLFPYTGISGSYSEQRLAETKQEKGAYGSLYSENGQFSDHALLDFNREKDGTFTPNTPNLPVTSAAPDILSVSGQGIGGSYKLYRGDVGHFFDSKSYSSSGGFSIAVELGGGAGAHVGGELDVNIVQSTTGKWSSGNQATSKLSFKGSNGNPAYENAYFKEANEKSVNSDPSFINNTGGFAPVNLELDKSQRFNVKLTPVLKDKNSNYTYLGAQNTRNKRDKRNQNISYITQKDYAALSLQNLPNISQNTKGHHISEVSVLGTDGSRYFYGLPLYNKLKKEVTFAVGEKPLGTGASDLVENNLVYGTGLITYNSGDNSKSNERGNDKFYSSISTPPYAHSYLLTAIVSPDYVDIENTGNKRGPSDGDLGNYTRFVYSKPSTDYKWRTPVGQRTAYYNEGFKSDFKDDKASYTYGVKELAYLDTIVSKNYIAVFIKSERRDGHGVANEDGAIDITNNSARLWKLDEIALYNKKDYYLNSNPVPIKKVIFEYEYKLCEGVPNFNGSSADGTGKLTLKKIRFAYQNSSKGFLSPYIFTYNNGPNYNPKYYDRWGNYKVNNSNSYGVENDASDYVINTNNPVAEFPYVEQNKTQADQYSAFWTLTEIQLPSGGIIKVNYESDDYAYVQNKRAMQMFKVVDYTTGNPTDNSGGYLNLSTAGGKKFYFKLQPGYNQIEDYIPTSDQWMYFRFLVDIKDDGRNHLEFVSGYGKLSGSLNIGYGKTTDNQYGWIKFDDVNLQDGGNGSSVNPIHKAAIQYGRLHMPKVVWGDEPDLDNVDGLAKDILLKLLAPGIFDIGFLLGSLNEIGGPNQALHGKNVAEEFVAGKSFIRLLNPGKNKLGGGSRVKQITMEDYWGNMATTTPNSSETSVYGQVYDYTLEDGTSSGVASYEPMLGGDEIPFRQPVYVHEKHLLVPDDQHYQEEPFGEYLFPSPSVGYSRVTVKNFVPQGVNLGNKGTGKVVNEFWTAKDFPTITDRTLIDPKRDQTHPLGISSLLKFLRVKDYMTATQGYYIELNDMHGKPKSQITYQEGKDDPISKVVYKYKKSNYSNGSFRLDNKCKVIYEDGSVGEEDIGVNYEFYTDFRDSQTDMYSAKVSVNLDVLFFTLITIPIPMIIPGFTSERTIFRSASTTKVVQRFGILEEIENTDLGSVVSIKNEAYDAETGSVLLTSTKTDFEDVLYSLKLPAYWYYNSMGPAYKNINVKISNVNFSYGIAQIANASSLFVPGDELALVGSTSTIKGWVLEVSSSAIKVVRENGDDANGTYSSIKVIRSGRRNLIENEMASITTRTNPLYNIKNNIYTNVLQASATEYFNKFKTYCNCFNDILTNIHYTINPYRLGNVGDWKPWRSYSYLSERAQSKYNDNTNIRNDGFFNSFNPFYKYENGRWIIDPKNWTYASEVTEWSPLGQEIENKDALGRYSAANFGYNQTLATAVGANARYSEIGFDNFEDYDFNPCMDDHFKFKDPEISNQAHSGRHSVKVSDGNHIEMKKDIKEDCPKTESCLVTLTGTPVTGGISVTAASGLIPYNYSWEIISGEPVITINTSGPGYIVNGTSWEVRMTVEDSNGCVISNVFNN